METWAIVTLVLGTSAVSALLTFFITKMQVSHSDKRLEKELERQREVDAHARRREVNSEPLLKLRDELAKMAAMSDKVMVASKKYRRSIDTTGKEKASKEQQEAMNAWHSYLGSGILKQTMFLQYDKKLVEKLHEVIEHYSEKYDAIMRDEGLENRKTWPIIIEVQELINKKLEKL